MTQLQQERVDVWTSLKGGEIADAEALLGILAKTLADGDRASFVAGSLLLVRLFPVGDLIAAAEKLCERGEPSAAERLLADARERFPNNLELLGSMARVAHRSGDHAAAVQRYRELRLAQPLTAMFYLGEANGLSDGGHLDEAAALLDEAVERFPRDLSIATMRATLAQKRGLIQDAIRNWAMIRTQFPNWPGGYVYGAKLCRENGQFDEAEQLLSFAANKFPSDHGTRTEHAWLARIRGNFAEAWQRWHQVRVAFPDLEAAYIHEAQMEIELGRFDAAEALLTEAVGRFPNSASLLGEWALLPTRLQRWSEADDRWRRMRRRFPQDVAGSVHGLRALRQLGRLDEAVELAAAAAEQFPDHEGLRNEIAQVQREQLERTRAGFAAMIQESPDDPAGYLGLMQCYADLKRLEDVRAVASEAQARFPNRKDVYTVEARIAEPAGDLQRASAIWREIKDRFPNDHEPHRQYLNLLIKLGDFETAEVHARETCERFPDSSWAFRDRAELAAARQDYVESIRRWTELAPRFGDDIGGRLHDLRIKLLDKEIELAQQAGGDLSALLDHRVGDALSPEDEENRTIMMTFESLGGLVAGCEFGAVQRAFGAEPLGLLRWSGMAMETLMDLLERKLINVGDRATTQIGYYDHGTRQEYSVRDKTFGFILHTHIFDNQMDEQTVFDQVTRRMSFLRRKLLDDLSRRDKIFMFKNSLREPSPEEIDRLDAGLRLHGRNLLLIATSASADNPNGTLKVLRDNLWLGYVDLTGEHGIERSRRWLQLCRVACARFHATA